MADPTCLPVEERSARDYAAWEAQQPSDVDWWVKTLGDTPARLDWSGSKQVWRGSFCPDDVAIKRWCAEKKVTPFAFAMCVTQQVLRQYCTDAFAVGTAYDTRPPQCADSIGMFVNTVLVPYAHDDVEAVQKQWVEMLPYAAVPYDAVVAKGYGTNVYLACNVGQGSVIKGAHAVGEDWPQSSEAKFDLVITWEDAHACSDGDDGNDGSAGWTIVIESGVGEWPRLIERIRHTIDCIINESPITLLPGEEEQVLKWGTGPLTPIPDKCIHEMFEEQARANPDAVALILGKDEMTYGELDRRSTLRQCICKNLELDQMY